MENKELTLTAADSEINTDSVEIIVINSICRLCASQNERLIGIFSDEGISNDLANKINSYLPIKVCISDVLPLQCCWNCASTVLAWHELVLNCAETDRKFKTSQIITDKEILGEAPYETSTPNDETDGSKDLLTMKEEKCETTDVSTESKYKCNSCGKTLTRRYDLKRHKLTCKSYENHIPADTTNIEDLVPIKETPSAKEKRHRSRQSELTPKFFCDICSKGFTRKHDMKRHMIDKHKDKVNAKHLIRKRWKNNIMLSKGQDLFNCDECGKRFTKMYYMQRHKRVHMDPKPLYCCHLCGKNFQLHGGLTRHVRTFHQGIRNFKCDTCQKEFTTRQNLDEHANIHTNERPFVCDICAKTFRQRSSLQIHMMYHSDVKRFQCDSCDKRFRRAHELKVHSWLHTGLKPYSCGKCHATFRLSHVLKRHLKTHETTKECICDDCGSVFSQEKYLKMHKKIHVSTWN